MKDGANSIIVLPQFQIDGMVEVMDFILANPYRYSVSEIKEKYDLNEEEYQMIYDFCMPHERHRANERYWATKYKGILYSLKDAIGFAKSKNHNSVPVETLETIMKRHDVSDKNVGNKELLDNLELPDEEEDLFASISF